MSAHIQGTKRQVFCHWGMPFKLNKTSSRVPDLPMHSGYSLCLVCGLTLGEKAALNDCDYLHSAAITMPLTTLEDVLMAWYTLGLTLTSMEKWQLECHNEVPGQTELQSIHTIPCFYRDWESIKGVSGSDCLRDCLFTAFSCFRESILATIPGPWSMSQR